MNYSISIEYLILLAETVNGVIQYCLRTNDTDRANLMLKLWIFSPLHYSPNYPSTWNINSQITFVLSKSLRWIWTETWITLFLSLLPSSILLHPNPPLCPFIFQYFLPYGFSACVECDGHRDLNLIQVYPKFSTFSIQFLKKLESDLVCKSDHSDKWNFLLKEGRVPSSSCSITHNFMIRSYYQ